MSKWQREDYAGLFLFIALLTYIVAMMSTGMAKSSTTDSPETFVSGANHIVLIFADWCGHCQKFKPEWMKFKTMARGIPMIRTSELDVDNKNNDGMIKSLGVNSFPTIIKIRADGSKERYSGDRSSVDLLQWAGN